MRDHTPQTQPSLEAELVRLSKVISRALRHRPESIGIKLDRHGWCDVHALVYALTSHGTPITREQLDVIVRCNDKARFALSEDGARIRAHQGHSVGVDLQLRPKTPPPVLYHGTVAEHLEAIRRAGLLPMKRHHVHLSQDPATAADVGRRHGKPVILAVDAYRMHREGHRFFLSGNGVWLVEKVPPQYLTS